MGIIKVDGMVLAFIIAVDGVFHNNGSDGSPAFKLPLGRIFAGCDLVSTGEDDCKLTLCPERAKYISTG